MSGEKLFALLAAWNIVVFIIYGVDKRKAQKGKWRISEAFLITCAVLMGGLGAFCGMQAFRHKTRHLKFIILVPVAILINAAVVWFLRGSF